MDRMIEVETNNIQECNKEEKETKDEIVLFK